MSKEPPEETEFREQPKETFNDDSEERVYGLFKKDGTKIGESRFTSSRFNGQAWYLRDICISAQMRWQRLNLLLPSMRNPDPDYRLLGVLQRAIAKAEQTKDAATFTQ